MSDATLAAATSTVWNLCHGSKGLQRDVVLVQRAVPFIVRLVVQCTGPPQEQAVGCLSVLACMRDVQEVVVTEKLLPWFVDLMYNGRPKAGHRFYLRVF